MSYCLAQLLSELGGQALAARRSDDKDIGWMQILVFVILSVFWALGSIVKAKANKSAPKGKEQTPRKPVRKGPERTVDIQILKQLFGLPEKPAPSGQGRPQVAKPQVRPASRKLIRPATARSAVMSPRPVAGRKIPAETKEAVKFPTFEAQPTPEKVLGLTTEVAATADMPQTKYLSEILSDYEDPKKLRRAILHYEILGKPISLREPSEHTIGF